MEEDRHFMKDYILPAKEAYKTRAALLGGYLRGPLILIMCGVQGSGKSTFCEKLLDGSDEGHWMHFSQDTIRSGKPGKRTRSYFVEVSRMAGVAAHVVLLNPPRHVCEERVRTRRNHPGGVQDKWGVQILAMTAKQHYPPRYSEGFALISAASSIETAGVLCSSYKQVRGNNEFLNEIAAGVVEKRDVPTFPGTYGKAKVPLACLGTMHLNKSIARNVVHGLLQKGLLGLDADLASDNEDEIGDALEAEKERNIFVSLKISKSAIHAKNVRDEVKSSLKRLKRSNAELLLLQWSCVGSAATTPGLFWQEMEIMKGEGLCNSIGVCDFSVDALKTLLSHCSVRPSVNQVEMHPLLPQWDLMDYCANNDITIQARTPSEGENPEIFSNSIIHHFSHETVLSPAQLIIQWNIMRGVPVVTKCASETQQRDVLFTLKRSCGILSPAQMKAVDGIGMLG